MYFQCKEMNPKYIELSFQIQFQFVSSEKQMFVERPENYGDSKVITI